MRFLALLVPVFALSLGSVACSGEDPQQDPPSTDDVQQQSQLVGEGDDCSVDDKCKPGLVCVARVKGGDVGIKGVPCGGDGCFQTSSSSSSSSSSGSTSSSGWSSSSSSSGSTSGWSSSSSSSGSTSGWSSSSSSSGSAPEVGICMRVR